MTEDDRDKGKEEVQALLKQYEDKIDEMAEKKTKEIMEAVTRATDALRVAECQRRPRRR